MTLDLASAVESGLITALLTVVSGSITLLVARGYLKRLIFSSIAQYIDGTLQGIAANPEAFVKTFKPVVGALLAEGFKGEGQAKEAMIKLPFVGRVPLSMFAPLIEGFLGKQVKQKGLEAAKTLIQP